MTTRQRIEARRAAAILFASIGGSSKSPKKVAASRVNGRKHVAKNPGGIKTTHRARRLAKAKKGNGHV